jgi:hypothetical protein
VKFNSFDISDFPLIIQGDEGTDPLLPICLQGCGPAYKQFGTYGTIAFYIQTKTGQRGCDQIDTPKITTGEWHLLTVVKGRRSLSLAVDDGAPIISTLNKSIATSDFIMRETGPIQLKGGTGSFALDGEVKGLCIHM